MVIDSAFCTANSEFLIKSSHDFTTADYGLQLYEQQVESFAFKPDATSVRQSAKLGMKAVQSSFPRLKNTLVHEEYGEQRIIFTTLFLLYNMRAHLFAINQITNVCLPTFRDLIANLELVPGR